MSAKTIQNSSGIRRGGLNIRFEKFLGVRYLVLQLGVENQRTPIDEGRGMDFFLKTGMMI
jgi:hypothetical protein